MRANTPPNASGLLGVGRMPRASTPPPRVRLRIGVGAAVVLVLLGVAVAVLAAALSPRGGAEIVDPSTVDEPAAAASETPAGGPASSSNAPGAAAVPAGADGQPGASGDARGAAAIYVHILGEVRSPGLYELHTGDRAIDAVAAAGGLTKKADDAQLNLARFLTDGEQIVVGRRGEPPPVGGGTAADGSAGASGGSGGGGAAGAVVNINTADAAGLEALPGVGPALAQRIIDWRAANGRFASVDDLLNVSGIGDKTLDGFRANVTV